LGLSLRAKYSGYRIFKTNLYALAGPESEAA